MDTARLRTEYEGKAETFERLRDVAKFVLTEEIKRKKIKIHSIPARIKSFNSFLKKAQDLEKKQGKEIKDPFTEIRDIIGLRVVCLFLDDLQKIADIIKTRFEVIEEENVIGDTGADIFKYYLPQFKVKLKDTSTHYKDIPFEIQVRTIAQDAWASISHCLAYKQEFGAPIPNDMERDFYALNGLFYVADTHFIMIRKELYKELESSKLK